jgi:hypothetical protein
MLFLTIAQAVSSLFPKGGCVLLTFRAFLWVVLPLALAPLLVAGCGREEPAPGELLVTSSPPGAVISIDGAATEYITPYTFPELEGGNYLVSVAMEGWTVFPGQRSVDLPYGGHITADFLLSQEVGALTVTSSPAGAAISLDGVDSGEVTPHTFAALPAGTLVVAVTLVNFISQPLSRDVEIETGGEATADFSLIQLQVPRVVLIEGFSNVYCSGCPTFNNNMAFVMSQEGYGKERLLYVKWPAYLNPLDPFWNQVPTITNARVTYYYGSSATTLPTAQGDGTLLGSLSAPPNAAGLMAFVDGESEFAAVRIDITTDEDLSDVADLSHEAIVTLMAPGGLDLSGYVLNIVLIYDEVTTAINYPFGNGQEFHYVLRDHVVGAADIGMLSPLEPRSFLVTLTDPLGPPTYPGHDIYPTGKQIVAFIQHATSKTVLQAGSTFPADPGLTAGPATGQTAAALNPHALPGGS